MRLIVLVRASRSSGEIDGTSGLRFGRLVDWWFVEATCKGRRNVLLSPVSGSRIAPVRMGERRRMGDRGAAVGSGFEAEAGLSSSQYPKEDQTLKTVDIHSQLSAPQGVWNGSARKDATSRSLSGGRLARKEEAQNMQGQNLRKTHGCEARKATRGGGLSRGRRSDNEV
jgi:hypothetical protein